jgi:hypothetical protein
MQAPGALTRGFIEACLVHEHGFRASDVTEALQRLRAHDYASNEVKYLPLDAGEAKAVDVYCYRRLPTNDERQRLRAMFQARREVLSPNVLRDAGEQYVRTMLKREAYKVHRLPLGEASMADGSCLDLFVTRDSVKYGVSVKNQREVVYPQSAAIFDVIARSRASDVAPFLVAPFISGEAKDACDERGVRYLELGAQVLPCETRDKRPMRTVVRDLRPILGPMPYKFQPAPRRADSRKPGVHLETKK